MGVGAVPKGVSKREGGRTGSSGSRAGSGNRVSARKTNSKSNNIKSAPQVDRIIVR